MQRLACVLVVGLLGCGDKEASLVPCEGEVTTAMSPSAGTVVIQGDFSEGQPILETISSDGNDFMEFVSLDYNDTMATFTGVPAGTTDVTWILSCFNGAGQATITGPMAITVQ